MGGGVSFSSLDFDACSCSSGGLQSRWAGFSALDFNAGFGFSVVSLL